MDILKLNSSNKINQIIFSTFYHTEYLVNANNDPLPLWHLLTNSTVSEKNNTC